ncbi:MAG: hypothetical protein HY235_23875 [Acidobacteria bacterium]|nr:hypothetical protein [Acidobacteriota bacterium]
MSPEVTLILKLQSLDDRIAELEREIAALPKRIAGIEKTLESHKRRLEMDRAALAGNMKERKRLEGDIQTQEQKISRLKDQMIEAKTNEQYRAFQHEIEYCQKEVRKYEDRILELMAESEPLELNVKMAEASLAEEARQVEAEKKDARQRTETDQKMLLELNAERRQAAAALRKDYYGNYERIRQRSKGSAVVEAVEGCCTGCHMAIRPQLLQELRQGVEGLLFCENCKRILYYNPPVNVQEQIA